jgi:hypothetical protein
MARKAVLPEIAHKREKVKRRNAYQNQLANDWQIGWKFFPVFLICRATWYQLEYPRSMAIKWDVSAMQLAWGICWGAFGRDEDCLREETWSSISTEEQASPLIQRLLQSQHHKGYHIERIRE